MSNEEWKLSGNCSECRRKNYCQTLCTKARDKVKERLTNKYYEELAKYVGEQPTNIIEDGSYKPDFKIKRKR